MAPPTIIAHKSTFLANQTLHLSQALTPSTAWRTANERAQDGLSARVVDDALYRLNHTLTQHARRVYAPQASRHVAEQVEGLFREEAERALRDEEDEEEDGNNDIESHGGSRREAGGERQRLRIGADFATDDAIASLPSTWDTHKPREASDHPLEARRYAELAATLTSLSARRREAREKVERLRRMAALLKPFNSNNDNTQPQQAGDSHTTTSVQESLIMRNGEVERELERMRLLLARVAGRVAQLPDKSAAAAMDNQETAIDSMDIDLIERDKVDRLLDSL
ncbi:kinetochore Sim4 complex subunit Fta4 [Xylariaceae sp. FL1651]|nr:kinetochore Sim4 complex subunit Fta4 [Xylariaceae sp. FL1651]